MKSATFQHTWDSAVRRHTDSPFLVFRAESGEVCEWTYGEFDLVVARTADSLRAAGVGPGSPVHVALRNCPAFVALWLAASRLGAWLVPVDPASSPRDIDRQVRRVRPAVGVCASAREAVYREGAGDRVPAVLVLAEDAGDVNDSETPLLCTEVVEMGDQALRPEDRLAVMFTSGTTAEPKGVVLTQANYAHVAAVMAEAARLRPHHRWHVTLPLFHANAQYYCFAPAIAVGASVALSAAFSASGWLRQARELGATHASLFAAPIRMILARTPSEEPPLQLEHVWFAQSLGAEHYEWFARLVGTRPRQLYGMTETVAIVSADSSEHPVHDVIGTPVADRRIRVADPVSGNPAAPGATGELQVLGTPGRDLFAGYLDDAETTARAFSTEPQGTWFATGDLVSRDADGVLRFTGRVDDVIKVSGENVSLTEVEAAVAQAPGVLEAAVVGVSDPVRDTVPVAYVVARDPNEPPRAEDLDEWADRNLAPAARPRAWHLIDELPRTSVGKVRRFRVGS
ncbi:class I adenylate-forming enzyme family protein [Streptomyces caeruleatus]|uniref:O-succinylbenzoate--CoA ligase n=1 Tax=Streptomyces caeruleatus TaxID=661399 RepID=A0A101U7D4_9ACTN|nr:AMP-binding protein [Streptomyces caeruleatus]KUO05546.1 O-succinylbenzoate--CoA ligase [Streptomyces caeruleatus]